MYLWFILYMGTNTKVYILYITNMYMVYKNYTRKIYYETNIVKIRRKSK